MKKIIYFFILLIGMISCSSDDENVSHQYEFVTEYSATVMVGGVVGISERTFQIGEVYTGTNNGNGIIVIRIAEHSELNDDCPSNTCYQEFLEVPSEFLKLVE